MLGRPSRSLGDFVPTPLRRRSRGPRDPRAAPAAPSLALARAPTRLTHARSTESLPRGLRPHTLTPSLAGAPRSPRRSGGSLAGARSRPDSTDPCSVDRVAPSGTSSPHPYAVARGGPAIPAPLRRLPRWRSLAPRLD